MKICPACQARMPEDTEECNSCGERFQRGSAKATMMGLPSMGSEEDSTPSSDAEQDQSKQTLWGMPALKEDGSTPEQEEAMKTEVVSADDLPFEAADFDFGGDEEEDDATREVQIDTIADALGASGGGDEKGAERSKAKETAFGLPAISAEESEPTQVKDKQTQDKQARETQEREVESSWGLGDGSVEEEDGDATEIVSAADISGQEDSNRDLEKEREEDQFGTLMGMNVPETFNEDGAGAMHRGQNEEDGEEGDQAATAALSAEKLAQFEEMGFPVGDDSATDWGSDELNEEAEAPAMNDGGDKTAVLDTGAAGFQLPKPRQKEEEKDDTVERTLGDDEEKQARKKPQSGVFRSAAPKRDSNPGQFDRRGVSGTGTYQMSNTERTNTGSRESEKIRDEDLSIGAVGSSKTSFPTGEKDEEEAKKNRNRNKKNKGKEEGRTGPRFAIGDTGNKRSRPRNMTPESSPSMASPESPKEVVPEPIEEPASPIGVGEDHPARKAPKQEMPKQEMPKQEEGSPRSGGFGAETAEPSKEPNFGAEPAGPSKEPKFGAEPAGQFGAEPAGSPKGPQGGAGFGAEPAGSSKEPSFGAEPEGPSKDPQGMSNAPQVSEQAQGQEKDSTAKANSGLEAMIAMIQRGFGVMASLAMMGVVAAVVATEGLPGALADLVLMGMAVVLGVGSVVAVALMADTKRRSMVMGLLAMVILVGFLAALIVEASILLALGLCAGALLLFFGAIFAAVGNWIGARHGAQ